MTTRCGSAATGAAVSQAGTGLRASETEEKSARDIGNRLQRSRSRTELAASSVASSSEAVQAQGAPVPEGGGFSLYPILGGEGWGEGYLNQDSGGVLLLICRASARRALPEGRKRREESGMSLRQAEPCLHLGDLARPANPVRDRDASATGIIERG